MIDPVNVDHLNAQYAASEDPWHTQRGWYEQRKRDLVLASLPRQRYNSAFEPGCSVGELTARLAERCDALLAADLHPAAVSATRSKTSTWPGVRVERLLLPQEWPNSGQFDLIVLSEIGYYFSPPAWRATCCRIASSLAAEATVLACHWLHDFDDRTQTTIDVHFELDRALSLRCHTRVLDDDFLLEVWTNRATTLGQDEGLA